jgi:hypothetical protein
LFAQALIMLVLSAGIYVIDAAPVTAQSTRQSMENLIYVAGEIDGSDSIIYRLGGLADPTTVQLNDDFEEGQAVAVSGNNVFVVWDSDSSEILYKRSIDGGATYSDIVILSDDSIDTRSQNPSISVVGSNIFVVWSDSGQILLRKSIDNGVNFGPPVLVSTLTLATQAAGSVDMIGVGNAVYVVWSENMTGGDTGDEIFFTKSVNGGVTFMQKINLSNNPGDSNSPSIGAFRNIVHIVWADSTTESGHREILYRKSFNGGNTFANAINLSNTQLGSSNPSLAVFNNNLYLVWEDQQGPDNFDIVFRKSNNNGITFDAALNLRNNPGDSRSAKIAASQDDVYVVWDDRTGKILGRDIFLRSNTGGISFGATTIIIPDASSSDIAVTPNVA